MNWRHDLDDGETAASKRYISTNWRHDLEDGKTAESKRGIVDKDWRRDLDDGEVAERWISHKDYKRALDNML